MKDLIINILEYFEFWDSTEEGYVPTGLLRDNEINICADKIAYMFEIDKTKIINIMNRYVVDGFLLDYDSIAKEIENIND